MDRSEYTIQSTILYLAAKNNNGIIYKLNFNIEHKDGQLSPVYSGL